MARTASAERLLAIKVASGKDLEDLIREKVPEWTNLDRKARAAISSVGKLWAFDDKEKGSLEQLVSLVREYVSQSQPARPLCIAVFGAPGSGKSRSIKQIRELVMRTGTKSEDLDRCHPLVSLNLTQLSHPLELARKIRDELAQMGPSATPFVFFDEFDTTLGGSPWGWLSWFLAPMQDAEFEVDGSRRACSRAIFVFAGGTASRARDFGISNPSAFAGAKGPDFASRLRGTLDVRGPNDPVCTDLRRALTIGFEMVRAREVTGCKDLRLTSSLAHSLLDAGRYRHGSRSIAALVEMSAARAVEGKGKGRRVDIHPDDLPPLPMRALHVDRGPLDPNLIGGLIGASIGFGERPNPTRSIWRLIGSDLFKQGACIGFGGNWKDSSLAEALRARALPERLGDGRADPYVELFSKESPGRATGGVSITACDTVLPRGISRSLSRAIRLTHMRRTMNARCVARVLVGGKTEDWWGRMPGIIEEAVWSLSDGRPIYLVGGFGGATRLLGGILGLARKPEKWSARLQFEKLSESDLNQARDVFCPASNPALPATFNDAVAWLMDYSIGGPMWPDNGLSIVENRELFESKKPDDISDLLRTGLSRVFGA